MDSSPLSPRREPSFANRSSLSLSLPVASLGAPSASLTPSSPSNLQLNAHLVRAGFLQKQSSSFPKGWRKRWFMLFALPQKLVYLSEKDKVVRIPLSLFAAESELDDTEVDKSEVSRMGSFSSIGPNRTVSKSGMGRSSSSSLLFSGFRVTAGQNAASPLEFLLETPTRCWRLMASSPEDLNSWLRAIEGVLALGRSGVSEACAPVEEAIAELQKQIVYGHVKYQGKTFLRPAQGKSADEALARVRAEIAALEDDPSLNEHKDELSEIIANYKSCLSRGEDLTKQIWVRIRAQDLIEQFKSETLATEVALARGEHELATARQYWEAAKALLERIQTEPEFNKQANRPNGQEQTTVSGTPSSGTPRDDEPTAGRNESRQPNQDNENETKEETAARSSSTMQQQQVEQNNSPHVDFIEDVQFFLDDLERRDVIAEMNMRFAQLGHRRRPSIVKANTAAIDRALFSLETAILTTGTVYKGTPFMGKKRVEALKEKARVYEEQLNEYKQQYGGESTLEASIVKYERAWDSFQDNIAQLMKRAEVHAVFEQMQSLLTQTSLSLAGRRIDVAMQKWVQVQKMAEELKQLRDEGLRSKVKKIAPRASRGLERSCSQSSFTEPIASDELSPAIPEDCPVFVFDINFFMDQFSRRAIDIEAKLASASASPPAAGLKSPRSSVRNSV